MKTLLKIFLISISLYACQSASDNKHEEPTNAIDSSSAKAVQPESQSDNGKSLSDPINVDPEMEKRKQLTSVILSSKQEINQLRSDVSDSLTRSGLTPQKRSLFSKTIQQLEESSDILNKQLESILVTDLQNSYNKLNGIVKKMQASQQELGVMIAKIDKINGYLQIATALIQSISPVKPVSTKPNNGKK